MDRLVEGVPNIKLLIGCRARTSHPIRLSAWAPQADKLCFRPPGSGALFYHRRYSTFPGTWVVRSCEKTRDRAGCLAGRRAPRSAVRESGESLRVRHSNSEVRGPRVYPAKQATQHCRKGPGTQGAHSRKKSKSPAKRDHRLAMPFEFSKHFRWDGMPKTVKNASRYQYGCRPKNPFRPLRSLLSSIWGTEVMAPLRSFHPNSSPEDPDFPVLQSQKSLPDFTTDQLRCLISPWAGHLLLTLNNLKLLDDRM